MNRLFTTVLVAAALAATSLAQSTGDWMFKRKETNGFKDYPLTLLEGNVFTRDSGNAAVQITPRKQGEFPIDRNLPAFVLERSITDLGGLTGISGVTFNKRTGTLFLVKNVSNGAGNVYEFTQDGVLLRTITNSGFNDTEGIAYVTSIKGAAGGQIYDVFLVSEEDESTAGTTNPGLQELTLCTLTPAETTLTKVLDRAGADPAHSSVKSAFYGAGGTIDNGGLETVIFDSKRSRAYYTLEFRTQLGSLVAAHTSGNGQAKIYQRDVVANGTTLSFGGESELCDITALYTSRGAGVQTVFDISDGCYDQMSDTIILQSDIADTVVRISLAGTELEALPTPGNQPEGVTINPNGDKLWSVGENNEFYRYGTGAAELMSYRGLTASASLNFVSTLATAVADMTITVTGAQVGDTVILGVPQAVIATAPTATFSAWVSAANTVTVRFSPKATEDPSAQVFKVIVLQ